MKSKTISPTTTSKTKTISRLTFMATRKQQSQMEMKRRWMVTNQTQRSQLTNTIIILEQIRKWSSTSPIQMPQKKRSRTMKNRKCQAQAPNHQRTRWNQAVRFQVLSKRDSIELRRNKIISLTMNLIRNKSIQTRLLQVPKDRQLLQLKEPSCYRIRKMDRKFRPNCFHQNQKEQRLCPKHIKLRFKERYLQSIRAILDQNKIKLLILSR